jgi:hypothetical protein
MFLLLLCRVVPCCCQVLEPKAGLTGGKDWESIGSRIGELENYDDDEQPLPQNVSAQKI